MAQYINGLRVPCNGTIQHINGFGHGDSGYDVFVTTMKNCSAPSVMNYFVENRKKRSVQVSKYHGGYFIEFGTYSDYNSVESYYNESCSLERVPRRYLKETVKAYRAYRMLFQEYISIRDEIIDATKGLEFVYFGEMVYDLNSLVRLLERSGFHPVTVEYDLIKTKEGICISPEGLCYNELGLI